MAKKAKVKVRVKKKNKRKVTSGIVHVLATFNNTIVTITDEQGQVLVSYSPPRVGFKNAKKRTAYGATQAAMNAGASAMEKYGLQEVKVYLKGAGVGRNAAVKGLVSAGLRVTMLADVTRTPHNGCRPKRKPRK